MDSEFRPLEMRERELLEKLLEAVFIGRDELHAQLSSVTAKQIIEDGTLTLRCDSGPPSPIRYYVAEGICKDADGGKMSVMLHLDSRGYMCMLEILKYDGSSIMNPPAARDLVLLLPEDGGRKPEE